MSLLRPAMWCSNCQQDVPGIASPEDGNRICCARCSGLLGPKGLRRETASADSSASVCPAATELPRLDDWSLEADLAAVTRMMQTLRIDSAPLPREGAAQVPLPSAPPRVELPKPAPPMRGSWFAWPSLMCGMMAFTCGAVLLGWSFATGRGDLWTFGMPAVLAGQALLILGLVLQLEVLWQNNRVTHDALEDFDRQLAELRQATGERVQGSGFGVQQSVGSRE